MKEQMDYYGFYTGENFEAYEYLGCHVNKKGAVFRTFAPAAVSVSVIGEFNGWTGTEMKKVYDGNFWECEIAGVKPGEMYKYRIERKDGLVIDHCDPYGYGMELRPNAASLVRRMDGYPFKDSVWMRKRSDHRTEPLNIYEIHAGSWRKRKRKNGEEAENSQNHGTDSAGEWYTYAELARLLIPYVKEQGYNYIELMPVGEHPSDNSWGYQQTGLFSPTSRYGTADELKAFVDTCHRNRIGVILDFVPVHFAVDGYALADYDGTSLYEFPHRDVGYNEWGSRNFNHSRGEVRSFLQSCANYWLKEYHFDGLRIDALSNLIYWQGNRDRGVNLGAVDFIKSMNGELKRRYPGIMLIAEDSTSYPGVTKPAAEGGLGFDYKWDMGWMNDTLTYFKLPPRERRAAYHKLTFSMMYYYDEQFLLPFSHDETVHGKAAILQKMNGRYEDKFPQARAMYMYMYAHPGKKLNFMGNEIGQLREWDERREQDWDILTFPAHDAFARFMRELNSLYLQSSAFSEKDYEREGFEWLDCHQEERFIYAFERRSRRQRIAAIFNFSDRVQEYEVPVKDCRQAVLLLTSDEETYGGSGRYERTLKYLVKDGCFKVCLAPFSGMYVQLD